MVMVAGGGTPKDGSFGQGVGDRDGCGELVVLLGQAAILLALQRMDFLRQHKQRAKRQQSNQDPHGCFSGRGGFAFVVPAARKAADAYL